MLTLTCRLRPSPRSSGYVVLIYKMNWDCCRIHKERHVFTKCASSHETSIAVPTLRRSSALAPIIMARNIFKVMEPVKREILKFFLNKWEISLNVVVAAMEEEVQKLIRAYKMLEEPWTYMSASRS